MTRATKVLLAVALWPAGPGCLVLKAQHDDLAKEVDALKKREAKEQQKLEETIAKAESQLTVLDARLKEAEGLLRSDQASLGVRVQNLESDIGELRGVAENAHNESAALQANLQEARQEFEGRINRLEEKLNEATNIPEGKQALLSAAEDGLKRKNYRLARQLFRTFLSRYPEDPQGAEVRFKIGLTFYSERDYRSALGEYYWIVQNAPSSTVIHDALYYSGLAFAKLGQCQNAVAYFGALTKKGSGAPDRYKQRAQEQIDALAKDSGKICTDHGEGSAEPPETPG